MPQVVPQSGVVALPGLCPKAALPKLVDRLAKQLRIHLHQSSLPVQPSQGSLLQEAVGMAEPLIAGLVGSSDKGELPAEALGRVLGGVSGRFEACAREMAVWCCPSAGAPDQERVVACIATLFLLGVRASLADAGGAAARQPHLACLRALRGGLLQRKWPQADTAVQQAVLASACALLQTLGTPPATTEQQQCEAGAVACLSLIAAAACSGIVSWPDAVAGLFNTLTPAASQLLPLCRRCLLGPLLVMQTPPRPSSLEAAEDQPLPRATLPLPLMDSGERHLFAQLQGALPAELAFAHALPALLAAAVMPSFMAPPDAASPPPPSADVAAGMELALHVPLRQCLLADPRAMYGRLASPSAVAAAAAAAGAGAGAPSHRRLPAATVVELLFCPDGAGVGGEQGEPFCLRLSLLLRCLVPARLDSAWLMLRLMMDEQAYVSGLAQVG